MELLSGFGKRGVELNLLTKVADILDTAYLSTYFVLQEFPPTLTAGKNSITFNGSDLLKLNSEILVECIDSSGNPLYIESTVKTNISYKESSNYILSIHVYEETSNGPGKLIFYSTRKDGATIKWVGDVIIDKTLQNSSTVRFYNKPLLEVVPILTPVLSTVGSLNKTIKLTGSFYSFAVNPQKDSLDINKRNVDVDYRLFFKNLPLIRNSETSFNSQIVGSDINIAVKTIQEPYSYNNEIVNFTSSFKVKKVINDSTIILNDIIPYNTSKNKNVVVNVVDGDFLITYPYIVYNTASESSSYLRSNTQIGNNLIKQSYANIIYRNIKTFSGFVSRHKVYKRSLFSPEEFTVIADEPLAPYELLQDKLTTNKSFDKMGSFYNQRHVDKYWFSSRLLQLSQSSDRMIESLNINYTGSKSDLDSVDNYIILKDNTSNLYRNPTYYSYNSNEFLSTSGSSYDSNFLELKKDVNYVISLNAILKKDLSTINSLDSGLEFYFTSSLVDINLEENSVKENRGLLKLGSIPAFNLEIEKSNSSYNILFNVNRDLYGTLVIVPKKCTALISELSLKPYGDYGFSPDVLITRIPFPVIIANETFEIKSELFDINSNLVYSDLRTITSFDVSGSSLSFFIPGYRDPNNIEFISGSLEISKSLLVGENTILRGSLTVGGTVAFQNIEESSYTNERMLAYNKNATVKNIVYTNVNNIFHDGKDVIRISLFEHPSSDIKYEYRLIPSIEGRNVFVPPNFFDSLEEPDQSSQLYLI